MRFVDCRRCGASVHGTQRNGSVFGRRNTQPFRPSRGSQFEVRRPQRLPISTRSSGSPRGPVVLDGCAFPLPATRKTARRQPIGHLVSGLIHHRLAVGVPTESAWSCCQRAALDQRFGDSYARWGPRLGRARRKSCVPRASRRNRCGNAHGLWGAPGDDTCLKARSWGTR
jgi:hypothetical protein